MQDLGAPHHFAYVVDDIEATVERLGTELGAGPFFLAKDVPLQNARRRGPHDRDPRLFFRAPVRVRAIRGERPDSNRRPPGPQPGALPTELRPPRLVKSSAPGRT
jgi:hypothetical protein